MCTADRIKALAKDKGIKIGFICSQIGEVQNYIAEVKTGKRKMKPEKLEIIAEILGTTPEYLRGETDDPETKKDPSTEPGSIRPDQMAEINRLWELLPDEKKPEVETYIRYLIETASKR